MSNKRWIFIASVLLLSGCGHSSTVEPQDDFKQALAYSQCMRANGVPDFPDPQQKGDGMQVDVGKGTDAAALKKAEAACRDKMPQGDADGPNGGTVDAAKLADWTTCMRAKLPKIPDPAVAGNTLTIDLAGTGIKGDSTDFENARQGCESRFPGGSLRVVDQS